MRKHAYTHLFVILFLVALLGWSLLLTSCSTVSKIGTAVGQEAGYIDEDQAASINRSAEAVEKAATDITPEQEYYIGRAVAASILSSYTPVQDSEVTSYLNLLGQTLALASDRPETFGGYHFILLDSDEVNAFAAPGGFIMITRGMVACCESEDALAAVLAHEIGHVENRHGLKAIKKSRLTSAFTILAAEGARNLGNEEIVALTEQFEGAVSDITSTLVNNGYSRQLESEADASTVKILGRVGYNPRAMVGMLQEMDRRIETGGPGFARTHPDPQDRIREIEPMVANDPPVAPPAVRQARFDRAVGQV